MPSIAFKVDLTELNTETVNAFLDLANRHGCQLAINGTEENLKKVLEELKERGIYNPS